MTDLAIQTPATSTNVYGNTTDLGYAQSKLGGLGGYNFINTSAKGYKAPEGGYTSNDLVVGGNGATGGVVDHGAANRLWGANSAGTNTAIDGYYQHAKAQADATAAYNPQYQAAVTAEKNTLALNNTNLENSRAGINTNFDNQAQDINRNSQISRNQLVNSMASRGLGRSSFYTSGDASLGDSANRLTNNVESARTGAMNGITANETTNSNNSNNNLLTMEGTRASAVTALANQYEQTAKDDAFKKLQFDQGVTQAGITNAYNDKVFNNGVTQQGIVNADNNRNFDNTVKQQGIANGFTQQGIDGQKAALAASSAYNNANLASAKADRESALAIKNDPTNDSTYKSQVGGIADTVSGNYAYGEKVDGLTRTINHFGALNDNVSRAIVDKAKAALQQLRESNQSMTSGYSDAGIGR